MRALVWTLLLVGLAGCGPTPMGMGDGGITGSVHVVFAPGTGPIDFANVPFPDDLYRATGQIEIGTFPGENAEVPGELGADPMMVTTMREAFHDLDGFGTSAGAYFRLDGDIDPSTLPATPVDSVQMGASVFMLDVESASPTAFDRIPVEVYWDAPRRLLAVRPFYGHALHEGRTYAVVVTSAVRAVDGSPLSAMPRFAAIRDATSRPSDTTDATAWMEYTPVLASSSVTRANVAGLAVFHVQHIADELDQARNVIRNAAPPALTVLRVASGAALDTLLGTPSIAEHGTDVPGGVEHSHIGTLIDGTFESPNFVGPTPFSHGPFRHDASGALTVQSMNTVWWTLALPAGAVTNLPVVVYQHGLGDDRSAVFAVADALCEQGFAVAAIDIPFHGMRAQGGSDLHHAFGPTAGPDLYGDVTGMSIYISFVGVADTTGPYVAFHPTYPRDTLRQSALDIMALVNALDRSDWSGVGAMGGPSMIGFASDPIGFVGVSLGGIIGTTFVTGEPRVGAAVLNVTGGELTNLVAFSYSFSATFLSLLLPSLGLDPTPDVLYAGTPPRFLPEVALYQTLLDRGDSMSFGPILAGQSKHVLFQMAYDDETVPNQATESLARAAGATIVGHMPRYSDLEMGTSPLSANLVVGSTRVTRGLTVFDPATHGLLSNRMSEAHVVHPPLPPFMELPSPTPVANPVDAAITQMIHFFMTSRTAAAEIVQ